MIDPIAAALGGVQPSALQSGTDSPHTLTVLASRRERKRQERQESFPNLPAVTVVPGYAPAAADSLERELLHAGVGYFVRADRLVRMTREPRAPDRRITRTHEAPTLVEVSPAMLQDDAERVVSFLAPDSRKDELTRVGMPRQLAEIYLSRVGRWQFPEIVGIAEAPVMRADGSLTEHGYCQESRVLVSFSGRVDVPERPTQPQAHDALFALRELVATFPYVGAPDASVAVAALLSGVARPALQTCPLFAFDAPTRGSGKSLLADVVAALATGRAASALAWPADPAEAEKRLGAAILSADPVLCVDNVEGALRGDLLNSALTQASVAIRPLGASRIVRTPWRALLLATGNNLQIAGDLTRRALICRLDPQCERPELRTFAADPLAMTTSNRDHYLSAALCVLRWSANTRPAADLPPLGSFGAWSRLVRAALVGLGMEDPCQVMNRLHEANPEREAAIELMSAWRDLIGSRPVTVGDAIRQATASEAPERAALRDALDAVAGGPGGISPKRLGRYLGGQKDRVIADMRLTQHEDRKAKQLVWRLDSV